MHLRRERLKLTAHLRSPADPERNDNNRIAVSVKRVFFVSNVGAVICCSRLKV